MKRQTWATAISAVLLAALAAGTVRAADSYTYRVVAAQGQQVPGGGTIKGDASFELGTMNASGAVCFWTQFDGGNGAVLASPQPDGTYVLQQIVLPGMAAPGGGTFTGDEIAKINVNDAGNLCFTAAVRLQSGSTVNKVFFYDKAANQWTVVMTKGTPAPGGGVFDDSETFISLNNADDIVFNASVGGSDGIYRWHKGQLNQVARSGVHVGSTTIMHTFAPQISDSGIITFEDSADFAPAQGVHIWRDGVLTPIATTDTVEPGVGDPFQGFVGPEVNSSGDVVFLGADGLSWGVYLYSAKDQSLKPIAQSGQDVPGGQIDEAEPRRYSARIIQDGSIFFAATLRNGDGAGVYRANPDGSVAAVAQTGREMKGVGTPEKLAYPNVASIGLAVNNKGQVAFVGQINGKQVLVLAAPAPSGAGQ